MRQYFLKRWSQKSSARLRMTRVSLRQTHSPARSRNLLKLSSPRRTFSRSLPESQVRSLHPIRSRMSVGTSLLSSSAVSRKMTISTPSLSSLMVHPRLPKRLSEASLSRNSLSVDFRLSRMLLLSSTLTTPSLLPPRIASGSTWSGSSRIVTSDISSPGVRWTSLPSTSAIRTTSCSRTSRTLLSGTPIKLAPSQKRRSRSDNSSPRPVESKKKKNIILFSINLKLNILSLLKVFYRLVFSFQSL